MRNIHAHGSATIDWIRETPSIAIPVYQRQYRWAPESCEQLLTDIRSVAAKPEAEGRTHFIGSVLVTPGRNGGVTLVDGQQRITTICLLLAAIRDAAAGQDVVLESELAVLLSDEGTASRSKLQTHKEMASTLDELLAEAAEDRQSNGTVLEDNYTYLRHSVESDWRLVWNGLQRLEHVTIELGPRSDAQQIFESLNSTGAPLQDHELIHNYIHMGRDFETQLRLEQDVWEPIETATAGATRAFWRDYLVLTSEAQADLTGEFGVYRAFRRRFSDQSMDFGGEVGREWVDKARLYGVLLNPALEGDPEISAELAYLHAFGRATFPLVLGLYGDFRRGAIDKLTLVETLEQIQSLMIRRALVGLSRDIGMIGTICREYQASGYPIDGLVRRTPEDYQVRLALSHAALPHAGYVLGRLQCPGSDLDLQVEHIYPQNPNANWSSDGIKRWVDLTTEEQAKYRVLLQTIGNLTLLESHLNQGASNRPFLEKLTRYYRRSMVQGTRDLATQVSWGEKEIERRTKDLTEQFLQVWSRASDKPMDEPAELIRVVDLERRPRRGIDWNEFEYATFSGEVWGDVHDVKALYKRVFQSLWATHREQIADVAGDAIVDVKVPRSQYDVLAGGKFLFTGWASQWLLHETQKVVSALELDDDVKVKLATQSEAGVGTQSDG